jgi:hypothetical protein
MSCNKRREPDLTKTRRWATCTPRSRIGWLLRDVEVAPFSGRGPCPKTKDRNESYTASMMTAWCCATLATRKLLIGLKWKVSPHMIVAQ